MTTTAGSEVAAAEAEPGDDEQARLAAEESALVDAFRGGDVDAFETIYSRYHRSVEMQARRVVRDASRIEDIVQEAFLRLVRHLLTHDDTVRLRPWLNRITTNLAIDEYRRLRVVQRHRDESSPFDELQRSLDRLDHGHPERMAEQSEIRTTIRQCVATLPAHYRQVLALRELDGLDYPSIGRVMGLSVSAVESLLFRARRRFTEIYRELSDEPLPRQRRRVRTAVCAVVPPLAAPARIVRASPTAG